MKLYGIKNCDTCKKALKALESAGHSVAYHDFRADGLNAEKISEWIALFGRDKVLNTRSTTWRGLSDEDKNIGDDKDLVQLIVKNPTLVKRPVIENDPVFVIGWGKNEQHQLLG